MQIFMDGIFLGSIYALFAIGFTLVFGVMRIVNLAHGALYLLGGSVGISAAAVTGNWIAGACFGRASFMCRTP